MLLKTEEKHFQYGFMSINYLFFIYDAKSVIDILVPFAYWRNN